MRLALQAFTVLVSGLDVDRDRLADAASDPLLLATDAAEALVVEGMPFRDAHERIAATVRDGSFEPAGDAEASVAARGGPGPGGVGESPLPAARKRFGDNL